MKKKTRIVISLSSIFILVILFFIGRVLDNYEFSIMPVQTTTNKIEQLESEDFEKKIKGKENFFIYVYSDFCENCKEFYPNYTEFLDKQDIISYQINSDNNKDFLIKELADKFQGTPAVYFYKDGVLVDYFLGNQPEKIIKKYVKEFTNYTSNEVFDVITMADFETYKKNNDEKIVYVGRPDCDDCLVFEPKFKELIKEYKLENQISYLDVQLFRQNAPNEWDNFKKENRFNQTPALLHIKNGEVFDLIQWDVEKGLPESEIESWIKAVFIDS